MGGCCILYCRNSSEKGFTMKSFPTIPEKKELWMKLIARPDWDPGLKSRVCEAHFTGDMWETENGKRFLRRDAVPTIFPQPPPRVINAEKRIIGRRRNERRSVLTDHAYVNKPAEIEVRIPDLPKVILQLNAEEAIQFKKVPESKFIFQKNAQPKIADGVQIELRKEQKLVNRPIFSSALEEQTKTLARARETHILMLPKAAQQLNVNEAKQLKRIPEPKSILQKNVRPKIADEVPIESAKEQKFVNKPIIPSFSEDQTKKATDVQEKRILEFPKEAKQFKNIQPKPILPKNFAFKIKNGIPIETVQEELKLVNRPIFPPLSEEQMKKLIDVQAKKLLELQKKLKAHKFAERKANSENGPYQAIVQSLFSDDQIRLLLSKQMNQTFTKSKKWSDATIEKALRFKSICGNGGYDELLKLGYPFPSLRTLNREKLKLSNSQESANHTSDDISKNITKKVSKNVTKRGTKRKVKVLKKVHNGDLIIDDKDLEDERESQRKKSKTED